MISILKILSVFVEKAYLQNLLIWNIEICFLEYPCWYLAVTQRWCVLLNAYVRTYVSIQFIIYTTLSQVFVSFLQNKHTGRRQMKWVKLHSQIPQWCHTFKSRILSEVIQSQQYLRLISVVLLEHWVKCISTIYFRALFFSHLFYSFPSYCFTVYFHSVTCFNLYIDKEEMYLAQNEFLPIKIDPPGAPVWLT